MSRDEIIGLAEKAGFYFYDAGHAPILHTRPLEYSERCHERFANLVIAEFLQRTGQYVTNDVSRDAALEQARAEERQKLQAELELARSQAATAEKWRGLATAKFGDGRTVQEIQREAAEAEREACLRCYSPDDTAEDWAGKIRARGQQ